jgi:hypothetical protein
MPKLLNKDEMIKHAGESHDQHSKLALLLIGAHAAGLTTCVTILRDAASTPQVGGIAAFTLLFGVGLLASIVKYGSVFMIRAVVKHALMSDEDPNDSPSKDFLEKLNVSSLAVSVLALVVAIVLVIVRAF